MSRSRVAQMRHRLDDLFPERHIYLRSGGETRGYVLSTRKQILLASAVAGLIGWCVIATGSVLINAATESSLERQLSLADARAERLIADRQARLDAALAQLSANAGSIEDLAARVERRHAALTHVMGDFRNVPGAATALAPTPVDQDAPAVRRIVAVAADQERLITKAEQFARSRAERLRLAFRLAGLNPASFGAAAGSGLGGPLIEANDPRALGAVLDVDPAFAARIQRASTNLTEMRSLQRTIEKIPVNRPAEDVRTTSGYGVRFDPFNARPTMHLGLDFAGPFMTPIRSTAPGVVSFAGVRSGYGNTVEIDHGRGFKTRYAHLQTFNVRPGERVAVGQRIGAMGSTGRSTGVHLHYEIWVNGRPQNPARFVKAGDYVQQDQ